METIIKPIITEKATNDSELRNRLHFWLEELLIKFKLRMQLKRNIM